MPLGRPNWRHWSRYLPSWSNIWMRLFSRSPTNRRPWLSIAMACASGSSRGPPGLRKRHRLLAVGRELDPLVADAVAAARIRPPQIAFRVERRAVREDEHAVAERLEELAARIVFEDRRLGPAGAGIRRAAMNDVDRAVGGRFDRG